MSQKKTPSASIPPQSTAGTAEPQHHGVWEFTANVDAQIDIGIAALREIRDQGKGAIYVASEVLEKEP